jgi:RNA polymerase primary sigma factor
MHSIAEYKAAFSCLFDELGRHPSVEEIASYMGYSIAKMNELISYSFLEDRYGNGMTSLDTDVGEDGNETTLGSLVIDERVGDLFDSFFEKETETVVQKQLDKLFPERVKEVITLRYGLGGKEKHTLEYVGERLGITRERVRQIQAKAVKEMKNSPELRALIN